MAGPDRLGDAAQALVASRRRRSARPRRRAARSVLGPCPACTKWYIPEVHGTEMEAAMAQQVIDRRRQRRRPGAVYASWPTVDLARVVADRLLRAGRARRRDARGPGRGAAFTRAGTRAGAGRRVRPRGFSYELEPGCRCGLPGGDHLASSGDDITGARPSGQGARHRGLYRRSWASSSADVDGPPRRGTPGLTPVRRAGGPWARSLR